MATKSLTLTQRHALETIACVRDMQVKKLAEVAKEMGGVPSRWVSVVTLTNTHHCRTLT